VKDDLRSSNLVHLVVGQIELNENILSRHFTGRLDPVVSLWRRRTSEIREWNEVAAEHRVADAVVMIALVIAFTRATAAISMLMMVARHCGDGRQVS